MDARLNMPRFTEAKWKSVRKKVAAGAYAVLHLGAKDELSPHPIATFTTNVDPEQVLDSVGVGVIDFDCKIHYLMHLLETEDGAERLRSFFRFAQDTLAGLCVYGYANVSVDGGRHSWKGMQRPHDIPVAFANIGLDRNLEWFVVRRRLGIKGTF
jgi:hypothetical protein